MNPCKSIRKVSISVMTGAVFLLSSAHITLAQSVSPPVFTSLIAAGPISLTLTTVGINNQRRVVGSGALVNGASHAFTFTGNPPQTDLGTLPGGSNGTPSNNRISIATAVSSTIEKIVGLSYTGPGLISPTHATLWEYVDNTPPGSATPTSILKVSDLGTLPSSAVVGQAVAPASTGILSGALGLNKAGWVVGSSLTADNQKTRAVAWRLSNPLTITDLGALPAGSGGVPSAGASSSIATAVSNTGIVVGVSDITGSSSSHAAQWQQTPQGVWTITDLGTLASNAPLGVLGAPANGPSSQAKAINNATVPQIVGSSAKGKNVTHATMWRDGQIMDLGTLGAPGSTTPADGSYSQANAVNVGGSIVGDSTFAGAKNGATHAVLWQDGRIYDLNNYLPANASGWVLTNATGIANDGTISGTGTLNGKAQAFVLAPVFTTETVLHKFAADQTGLAFEGSQPIANLIQATDGNFYGTASATGPGNGGTVFRVTPDGVLTVLHAFDRNIGDGALPAAPLMQGTDGMLYGTTQTGGAITSDGPSQGTIFRLNLDGSNYTVLHSFPPAPSIIGGVSTDGVSPTGGLAQGADGNFYGTTSNGGTLSGGVNGSGTVFRIAPDGSGFTVLHTFGGAGDGAAPLTGLTLGRDGNFYGTTRYGGTNGSGGTVFRITPTGDYTILYSFHPGGSGDGQQPLGALVQGADGNFYGTTSQGGPVTGGDSGTVFQITPAGIYTTLYAFTYSGTSEDGNTPTGNLVLGADGNFYGTTFNGGSSGINGTPLGTVFRVTPTGVGTVLYSFRGVSPVEDGSRPLAGLVQGTDGAFYGVTSSGGPGPSSEPGQPSNPGASLGTIFRLQ